MRIISNLASLLSLTFVARAKSEKLNLRAVRRLDNDSNENDELALSVAPNTLTNQIICGYQGWFAFPGDGAPINKWKHWFKGAAATMDAPGEEYLHIDMYPTTDEYNAEDMKEAGIKMSDGSYAKFYSAARPNVVLKHFEWMETYGITGVFHMRFMESIHITNNRNWKTMVLRNVRSAAEATGRVFAVSYNIAGNTLTNDVLDDLKLDWIRLVDEEEITQSNRYIRQNGLPVLRIFGIGFKSVRVDDTTRIASLIDWFQNTAEEKYRVFLIGGVPSRWRDRINDSSEEIAWEGIYNSLDGLHPWTVGRWRTPSGFETYYSNVISKDANHCASNEILYMPTMWPGFSWHNLNNGEKPINDIPRLGGTFMWKQAYGYANNPNIFTVWLAQFDEVDEATAIYKVTAGSSDLPADGKWLALDADGQSLPSDWYLRLAGEAQRMMEGTVALNATIPIDPSDPLPTSSPTNLSTPGPTNAPSTSPTGSPTKNPTQAPTSSPSAKPTSSPTKKQTLVPTNSPTDSPVPNPTDAPSKSPRKKPTITPTDQPSDNPTVSPIQKPTEAPSNSPPNKPTSSPSTVPTDFPITSAPAESPTGPPSKKPTSAPTGQPSPLPSNAPMTSPTGAPTHSPSRSPTILPSQGGNMKRVKSRKCKKGKARKAKASSKMLAMGTCDGISRMSKSAADKRRISSHLFE